MSDWPLLPLPVAPTTLDGFSAWFSSIKVHVSRLDLVYILASFSGRCGWRPQPLDEAWDLQEEIRWHRHLGHLEDDIAAVAHNLGADLHELLSQAGERPVLDRLREGQGANEVGQVVGERVKLKTDSAGLELPARQPCPLEGVLAFLDILLRRAALRAPSPPKRSHG